MTEKKNLFKLQKRSGAALVMVMVVFLFVSILLSSVFILGSSNTREVVNQEQGIKSYYIARSGAETTYQALLTTTPSLLEQFKTNSTAKLEDTLNFDEGIAEVKVILFTENSTKRIRITSLGKASTSKVERRSILEFDLEGYSNIKWSK